MAPDVAVVIVRRAFLHVQMPHFERDKHLYVGKLHMAREINMTGYDYNMQTKIWICQKSLLDMEILTQKRFVYNYKCNMILFRLKICTINVDMPRCAQKNVSI